MQVRHTCTCMTFNAIDLLSTYPYCAPLQRIMLSGPSASTHKETLPVCLAQDLLMATGMCWLTYTECQQSILVVKILDGESSPSHPHTTGLQVLFVLHGKVFRSCILISIFPKGERVHLWNA